MTITIIHNDKLVKESKYDQYSQNVLSMQINI